MVRVSNIQIIDEEIVLQAAEFLGGNSAFTKMLGVADEYREADMTPMFLLDLDSKYVFCVAKETFNKKLN
jgi:hypothetical protein